MIRATNHNKRIAGQRQRHNDRSFDTGKASHIDASRTKDNITMTCYKEKMTFDEAERRFYEEHIGQALQEQNDRYIKAGHRERCRTIDEYRTAKQTCPEETLYYLGKKSDGDRATSAQIMAIYNEYHKWQRETFPLIVRLNVALHRDEPDSADHIHERKVYLAHKDGKLIVSQNKCFEELGIQRPDPSKPQSRYNNPKQTYSKMCRDKFIEIATAHGLEIETEPQEPSRKGLTLMEYKTNQEQERLEQVTRELDEAVKKLATHSRSERLNRLFYEALNEPIVDHHPNRNTTEER